MLIFQMHLFLKILSYSIGKIFIIEYKHPCAVKNKLQAYIDILQQNFGLIFHEYLRKSVASKCMSNFTF